MTLRNKILMTIVLLTLVRHISSGCNSLKYLKYTQYGEPCGPNMLCDKSFSLFCEDGICKCKNGTHLLYHSNSTKTCGVLADNNLHSCRSICPSDQFCGPYMTCQCPAPKVLVQGKCYEVAYNKPMEACNMSKTLNMCDDQLYSYCQNSKCICFRDFFYNFTSASCERKQSSENYQEKSGLSSKSSKGQSCFTTYNCVHGLICISNYTCDCPRSCTLKMGCCDCGEVSISTRMFVYLVGLFFSLLSAILLCVALKKKRARSYATVNDIMPEASDPFGPFPPANPTLHHDYLPLNHYSSAKAQSAPPYYPGSSAPSYPDVAQTLKPSSK